MPRPGQPQPTQAPPPRRRREQLSHRHGLLTARHRPLWRSWREPYLHNGVPMLSFRLASERGTSLRDPRLRAYLAITAVSQEGHRLRRLRPLRLERKEGVALLLVWTAMHRIDAESPLHGLDQAALERLNGELVGAFSGIDATLERPLHAESSWPGQHIRFGACFADMVSLPDNRGERRIDWSVLDQIRPCP